MEIWDLYDKNKNKLNETMIRGDEVPKNYYRLAVKICIFNKKNEMLIQQRQSFKKESPNLWDLTTRGSAISGEDSEQAIKRELKEELSIDLNNDNLRPVLTVHDKSWFDDVFLIKREVDISKLKLQTEEVKSVKWASKDDILEMIRGNIFIQYPTSLINFLFHMVDEISIKTTANMV